VGLPGVPSNLQHDSGYCNVPNNSGVDHDLQRRTFGQVDATYFLNAAGAHQIKGGVQIDRRLNDVISGELQNLVTLNWSTPYTGNATPVSGAYGYYEVRGNAVSPKQGLIT